MERSQSSPVILDLEAFYARAGEAGSAEDETYLERVQYMFRSDPPPSFDRSTTVSSGSSPRPGGRTSSARRAGTGPSRCWS